MVKCRGLHVFGIYFVVSSEVAFSEKSRLRSTLIAGEHDEGFIYTRNANNMSRFMQGVNLGRSGSSHRNHMACEDSIKYHDSKTFHP
jgi:hypothetical protein